MLASVSAYINAHGGPLAVVGIVLALYNLTFSAIAKVCNILKIQENPKLIKAGEIGSSITSWFSANLPTVPSPSQDTTNEKLSPPKV